MFSTYISLGDRFIVSELISFIKYTRIREIIHLRLVNKVWKDAYDITKRVWTVLRYEDLLFNKEYCKPNNIIKLIRDTPFSKYLKKIKLCIEEIGCLQPIGKEDFNNLCAVLPKSIKSIDVSLYGIIDLGVLIDINIRPTKLFIRNNIYDYKETEYLDHIKILIYGGLQQLMVHMDYIVLGKLIQDIRYISYIYVSPRDIDIGSLLSIGVNKIEEIILHSDPLLDEDIHKHLSIIISRGIKIRKLTIVDIDPKGNPLLLHSITVKHIVLYRFDEYTERILSLVKGLKKITILNKVAKSCIDALCKKDNITFISIANVEDEWFDELTSKFSHSLRILRIQKLLNISLKFVEYVSRLKMLNVLDIMELERCCLSENERGIVKIFENCRYLVKIYIEDMCEECNSAKKELRYLW